MIKGGVWRNTEDEILKAAVMKYGKNQVDCGERRVITGVDQTRGLALTYLNSIVPVATPLGLLVRRMSATSRLLIYSCPVGDHPQPG
jgi:hypothetical protein